MRFWGARHSHTLLLEPTRYNIKHTEIRARPPDQTPHIYACWHPIARSNLAFIANQLGHKDYSMLVTVYDRWVDTKSSRELERI